MFIIGETCLFGLAAMPRAIVSQLEQQGLGDAMDKIHDFCHNISRYSVEAIAMTGVEKELKSLLKFITSSGLDLPNRLPELGDMIGGLADTIGNINVELEINN